MQKNCEDFSMEQAMRMAKSPAGQQLLAMLKQSDAASLQQAMELAKAGDMAKASSTLQSMLSSGQAQALLKKLEESGHG